MFQHFYVAFVLLGLCGPLDTKAWCPAPVVAGGDEHAGEFSLVQSSEIVASRVRTELLDVNSASEFHARVDKVCDALVKAEFDEVSVRELLQEKDSLAVLHELLPGETIGFRLKLLRALRRVVDTMDSTLADSRVESNGGDNDHRRTTEVLSLSAEERKTLLHQHLLEDYDINVPPENVQVQISIHFFKVTEVNLVSSQLVLNVWFRALWTDNRLAWDASVWNLSSTSLMAESNSLENSLVWTPDIELYNADENLPSSLGAMPMTVTSDGGVYWSRPGRIHAMCSYKGLSRFPFDSLSCDLEFAGWNLDGDAQDITLRTSDGGVGFETRGLTGSQTFQDYRITRVTAVREVLYYGGSAPWPELLYTVSLSRATPYYVWKFIIPQIIAGLLSFVPYFMSPECGERLGFGITLVLAILTTEVVSMSMMPVTDRTLVMDSITRICFLFCVLSLLESALAISIFYLEVASMSEMLPRWCRRISCRLWRPRKETKYGGGSDNGLSVENQHMHLQSSASNKSGGPSCEQHNIQTFQASRVRAGGYAGTDSFDETKPDKVVPDGCSFSSWFSWVLSGDEKSGRNPAAWEVATRKKSTSRSQHLNGGDRSDVPVGASSKPRSPTWVDDFGTRLDNLETGGYAGRSRLSESPLESAVKTDKIVRTQLYRRAFFFIDQDFTNTLSRDEINKFGRFVVGREWNDELTEVFMREADTDVSGGLNFNEFVEFNERMLFSKVSKELAFVQSMIEGFIAEMQNEAQMIQAKWRSVSLSVDRACRVIFPPVFLLCLAATTLTGLDDDD